MKWITAPLLIFSLPSLAIVPTKFRLQYLPVADAVDEVLAPGQHPNPKATLAELGGFNRAKFDLINQKLVERGGRPADPEQMKWSVEGLEKHAAQITIEELTEMMVIACLARH